MCSTHFRRRGADQTFRVVRLEMAPLDVGTKTPDYEVVSPTDVSIRWPGISRLSKGFKPSPAPLPP